MYDGPVKITRPNLSRHRTMGMEMHVSAPVATPPFPVPFGQFDSAQAASQFVAGQVHLPNKRICTMTIRQNAIYCASVKSSAGTLCKTASPGSVGTPARLDFTCSTTSSTEDSTTEEIDKFAKVEPDTTSNLVTKTVNASSFRSIDSRSSVSDIQSEEPQEALKLDISVDAAHIFVPTPIKAVYQDLCQVFAHSPSPFTMRFPLGGGDSVSECSIRCSPFQSSCMSAFSPISIAAINQPSPTDFYELKDGRFHSAVIVGTTNLGCDPSDCTSMSSMDNVDDGASTFSRMSPVGGDLSHPLDMSMICVDGTDEIVPCQLFLTI